MLRQIERKEYIPGFFSRWIGQLEVMAGEIRQAGICDMVEEKEIPADRAELLIGNRIKASSTASCNN